MASDSARVLVLDAQHRHSLAIVRSLGRRGINVVCASPERRFPARYSRYTSASHVIRYSGDGDARVDDLLSVVEAERISVIVPAAVAGTEFLCRHRDHLEPHVRAPFNDLEIFERLACKEKTVALASTLDVPYPRTIELEHPDRLEELPGALGYPIVVKATTDQGGVRYARDLRELRVIVADLSRRYPSLMAQEYIDGDACGFFALAHRGELLAYFMHRRLHEVPPSGGPSAMAASYRDPILLDLGSRLLSATAWSGVAMVEFKKSRNDGIYYLLEVNPKFWGSLDLSIAAGVDFPYLLHRLLTGRSVDVTPGSYEDGCVFRWLTMDFAYSLRARRLGAYFRDFADRKIHDDLSLADPLPFAALVLRGVRHEL